MSYNELHIGTLKEIDLGELTIEDWCKSKCDELELELYNEDYDWKYYSYLELLLDTHPEYKVFHNKYFGEEVPIKYNSDFDILQEYVDKWIKKHNFNVEEDNINYYNFEYEYVSLTSVYSFDDKFYSFDYFDYGYDRYEIDCEPYEVEQITETVEINRYVKKR